MTSMEIHNSIGHKFPKIENRRFYKYANGIKTNKVVNEFTPSKYFKHLPLMDDDANIPDINFIGPNTGQCISCAHTESNMKRGFLKRMVYGGDKHYSNFLQSELRNEFYKYFIENILPQFEPLPGGLTYESSLENWLSHCKRYTLKTKQKYRRIQKQILNHEYQTRYCTIDDPMGFRSVNLFIKSENYTEIKEPRLISPCSESWKALMGGYFHAVDQYLINTQDFLVKGKNPRMISECRRQIASRNSCFFGSDFSSFEGSQDYEIQMNIELKFYEHMFANYEQLIPMIRNFYEEGRNYWFAGKYVGHMYGKRCSGDMQTSIGNSILNYSLWKFASFKQQNPIEILVEGDDAFIATQYKPIDFKIVTELGFDVKPDGPSGNYEDITFLSQYQYKGNTFGNLPKLIDKVGTIISTKVSRMIMQNPTKFYNEFRPDYLYTKAYCFHYQFRGTPILDVLLEKIMELSGGHLDLTLMEDYYLSRLGPYLDFEHVEIPYETRLRVAELWPHITLEYQYRLEEDIRKMTDLSSLIINFHPCAQV